MLERGEIGFTLADALLAEYDRRVQNETLYGFLPSLTLIVKKNEPKVKRSKNQSIEEVVMQRYPMFVLICLTAPSYAFGQLKLLNRSRVQPKS